MRPLLIVLCASVLLACSPSKPTDAEPSSPATAKAAPVAETRALTIRPDALRVAGDHVLFEPDRKVQRSQYDTYRFDKAAFQAKVGTLAPTEPIRLTVEVIARKEERRTPSDPRMPSPEGGFVTTTYECRVVRVER